MNPSKEAIVVRDMHSLKREKVRLRSLCHAMEAEAEERVEYVKKHYGMMAFNSIFPHAATQAGIARLLAVAVKSIFKSSRLQTAVITALITVLEFIGVKKLSELIRSLFSNREEKKENGAEE